jgi:hypothetical protein
MRLALDYFSHDDAFGPRATIFDLFDFKSRHCQRVG